MTGRAVRIPAPGGLASSRTCAPTAKDKVRRVDRLRAERGVGYLDTFAMHEQFAATRSL
ncbi:hypothetical protein ACIG3E_32600 [Streptomyces sp. NPDC053474]|uniref:hypothetical protein n=1 Tax=Streptomyces sp. NPDC053474 TaxID=3365704 RepID=UPI0037D24438